MGSTVTQPGDNDALSELALVRRAGQGDRGAFDHLMGRYRAPLLALAFMRTGDRDQAEDLVQEVVTRAWQQLPSLRDSAAFLPWLKTILANACNSWQRRSRARPETGLPDDSARLWDTGSSPLEQALARERQRELWQALLRLPAVNRTALLMAVWGGATYQEIADFTQVAVSTVEGRIFRAKRKLRHLLHDQGADLFGSEKTSASKRIL